MAFHCDIVTPDRETFSGQVKGVVLPAHDGLVGILTGRAPMLVRLGTGKLTADLAAGGQETYAISGGVAQMKDNRLTILTEKADAPAAADTGEA